MRPTRSTDPNRIGHHDLIEIYGGSIDWEERMSVEMKSQVGKLLVAGISILAFLYEPVVF